VLLAWATLASIAPGKADALDPRALPLGDGKVSSAPKRGYVFSCTTRFRGGGARHAGDWIHGSTWDATEKIAVRGEVFWPEARFSITTDGDLRRIVSNGLPFGEPSGVFPVRPDDPAYRIDRNPNSIELQNIALSLPREPRIAARPSCVPMGMIGITMDGVALFDALDAAGRDAVAHEVQDRCNGHPQSGGEYHYHGPSPCLPNADGNNVLIGYALDGFGITSGRDENGRELTNADLDECHGRVSRIQWDGKSALMYHYVLTREYPYTVGCFRGTPVRLARRVAGDRPARGFMRSRPPPESVAACAGRLPGLDCEFESPRGDTIRGHCRVPDETLACVPDRR
jgi:YHYH protein